MNRVAVVTGGGSGIGENVALTLAANGWTVVVVGRRAEALRAVAAGAGDASGVIDAVTTDVTDEAQVRRLFDHVVDAHGRVDLLFNNAGAGAPARELDEVSLTDWNAVVAVNLTGVFLCTREAFRVMRRQDPPGGRIVNNGSIAAHSPRPRSVAYTATKHAVTGLSKQTALDGRAFGIACGQIDIGNAATGMASAMTDGIAQADGTVRPEPVMDVADVGRAVLFMADLPASANVFSMTIAATTMPFVGRG